MFYDVLCVDVGAVNTATAAELQCIVFPELYYYDVA